MTSAGSHYETLGLGSHATASQVRGAYRRLARLHHPDVDRSPDAAVRFAAIANAYEVLNDPQRRLRYDRELAEARQRAEAHAGFDARVPHYNWSNIASRADRGGVGVGGGDRGADPGGGPRGRGEGQPSRRPTRTEADEIYETFFTKHDQNGKGM